MSKICFLLLLKKFILILTKHTQCFLPTDWALNRNILQYHHWKSSLAQRLRNKLTCNNNKKCPCVTTMLQLTLFHIQVLWRVFSTCASVLLVDRTQCFNTAKKPEHVSLNSQMRIRYPEKVNYRQKCRISMQFNSIIITISCLPCSHRVRPEATALVELLWCENDRKADFTFSPFFKFTHKYVSSLA